MPSRFSSGWRGGAPHNPYGTAPEKYRARFDPAKLPLRPNVPEGLAAATRKDLAGYSAHAAALDDAVGDLRATWRETGLEENTIVVFTADHGDMLGSQGMIRKQEPSDESARVPMLMRWPAGLGKKGRVPDAPIQSEDLMPTLPGFAGLKVPGSVEGLDSSGYARGGKNPGDRATVLTCVSPFGEFERRVGGKKYRGIRTTRYTYVRDLNGPWLFFDNKTDPYRMKNLVGSAEPAQAKLEAWLGRKLKANGHAFLRGPEHVAKWGYTTDPNGTMKYRP